MHTAVCATHGMQQPFDWLFQGSGPAKHVLSGWRYIDGNVDIVACQTTFAKQLTVAAACPELQLTVGNDMQPDG